MASLAIALTVQTAASAQAPGPGSYSDPNYVPGAGDPSLRIPRTGNDLRGPMDNSYAQPNASLPAPAAANYGAPAGGGYGAPAQGGYGAPAAGGYAGAPAQGGDPNAYQDPNAVQPYPNKYQKSKHGPSGVGMVVGGPAKAATTSVGVAGEGAKYAIGGTGKAVKEVFKAIF